VKEQTSLRSGLGSLSVTLVATCSREGLAGFVSGRRKREKLNRLCYVTLNGADDRDIRGGKRSGSCPAVSAKREKKRKTPFTRVVCAMSRQRKSGLSLVEGKGDLMNLVEGTKTKKGGEFAASSPQGELRSCGGQKVALCLLPKREASEALGVEKRGKKLVRVPEYIRVKSI